MTAAKTIDSANFRGHRLTYLEKVTNIKWTPRVSTAIKYRNKRIGTNIKIEACILDTYFGLQDSPANANSSAHAHTRV